MVKKPSNKLNEKPKKTAVTDSGQLFVIAHNIRSLYNVGSIFRTADSFGVSKIYLSGYTGIPEGTNAGKIGKVALGAEQFVSWEQSKSLARLVTKLRKDIPNIRIVALENNVAYKTIMLQNYKPKFPLALILGEETKGNTKKILNLTDDILEIPMSGQKESLNVATATGIALYALRNNK